MKKRFTKMIAIMLSAIMVLSVLGSGIVPGGTVKALTPEGALTSGDGISATADSVDGSNSAENAIDGDKNNKWQAKTGGKDSFVTLTVLIIYHLIYLEMVL